MLVGGIALFLRFGSVTRPTADANRWARPQAALLARLEAEAIPAVTYWSGWPAGPSTST